jgi:hypothetical protein
VLLLGFEPNTGEATEAQPNNAYNLFRAVIGGNPIIAKSDINANFYSLDQDKYDDSFIIGGNNNSGGGGTSGGDTSGGKVGKGFLKSNKKDVKYSVMGYLNLKNNATLTHVLSRQTVSAELIPNAISNAYLIKRNDKCFNYDNVSFTENNECDQLISSQIFSIILTGNKKNECKIQHYDSKKYLIYVNGIFTLVDNTQNNDYTLFIMT